MSKNEDLTALLPFATDAQAAKIRAVIDHGDGQKAAKFLGVTHQTVYQALKEVRKKAALRGWAPEFNRTHTVPETEKIKGHSHLYDADGKLDRVWVKTREASADPETPAIFDAPVTSQSVMTDAQGQRVITWERRDKAKQEAYSQAVQALADHVKQYRGIAAPTRRGKNHVGLSRGLLEVYPLGDPHIGMLAWGPESGDDFDLKIAESELCAAVDLLAEQSKPASEALLVNLGDYFHANDETQLTPGHHHKLSVDSRIGKIVAIGFNILRRLTDRLLTKHDRVTIWNVAGNHDPLLALMLNLWVKAVYEREPRVVVPDNFAPYFYRKFGKCLIGGAHGHLCKPTELGPLMATDQAEDWGTTEYRHWLTGHVHHDELIELPGVTVERFRTLAPKDAYAATRWRSLQALQALTFHETYGLIARRTVGVKLARARLDGVL